MRSRIWKNMANVKFKSIYTNECARRVDAWGTAYSFFLSLASASSVSAWAIWKEAPAVWTCIVMIAQFLHVAKPYLPFLGHGKNYLEMSFQFERLYLDYERLWVAYENDRLSEEEAESKFYELRERATEIEESHKQMHCWRFKGLIAYAERETFTALALNFGTKENEYEREASTII